MQEYVLMATAVLSEFIYYFPIVKFYWSETYKSFSNQYRHQLTGTHVDSHRTRLIHRNIISSQNPANVFTRRKNVIRNSVFVSLTEKKYI